MKKRSLLMNVLLVIGAVLLIMVCIVLIRTWTFPFVKYDTPTATVELKHRVSDHALQRFAGGIRIPTVSTTDYDETDFRPFDDFKAYLPSVYPEIYRIMDTLTINNYGLVFRWAGKNPKLKPILFLSHYDVVPVIGYEEPYGMTVDSVFRPNDNRKEAVESIVTEWDYPPFSGAVVDGRVYGRGTLDMKCMLFGVMEAADALIAEDFQPDQDIWFAFGHDEEVGGRQGAVRISEYFEQQGLTFDAVYDEGGLLEASGLGFVDRPIGVVGTGEKGFLTLKINVYGVGGHSSMPPEKGSLVMAAEIIEKLHDNQLPQKIITPVESFLRNVGGEFGFTQRMAIANQWLFGPILLKSLGKAPSSNALTRTTTAVTMARGSDAPNVLSSVSEVVVNFRLLPGDTTEEIIGHVENICQGYDVSIETVSAREPSSISPEDTRAFRAISQTVAKLYTDAILSSYITIGGTDAYKYQNVSDHIYRFLPISLNQFEQRSIHNENEYISIDNFGRMIEYYRDIMVGYQSF